MKRITLLLLSFFWLWGAMASVKDVKITYKVEVDGWTQGKQLSTVLSSYSAMCLQQDGNIAFFFEEAPCYDDDYTKGYCMVYLCLSVEDVTEGKYSGIQ